MEESSEPSSPDMTDITTYTYTKKGSPDHTLDDAHLATQCPLDNGKYTGASFPSLFPAGQLDELPAELLVQILLSLDIPSLTRFRRVNRRAMELVDSIPQYAAIIRHCPDIIRAILSINAEGFNCRWLYATLGTTKCYTCRRFGDHLYLIACRRVCYFCFTHKPEYLPLERARAAECVRPVEARGLGLSGLDRYQLLDKMNRPKILSLPGKWSQWDSGIWHDTLQNQRLELFDRQALTRRRAVTRAMPEFPPTDQSSFRTYPLRFTAIITAPYLFDFGRQADWGYFCVGCKGIIPVVMQARAVRHFRFKYTREGIAEHIARFGPIKYNPDGQWTGVRERGMLLHFPFYSNPI